MSAYNVDDWGSIPGSGRSPGEGHGNPLQYSFYFYFLKFYFIFKLYIIVLVLPNIKMNLPQVQSSLMGYSPWACKESDPTEGLIHTLHFLEKITKFYFMSFFVVVVELGQLPLTTLPDASCVMKLSTLAGENI